MSDLAFQFLLIGTRFSKLIIDETQLGEVDDGELEASVKRRMIGRSEHMFGERPVIEIVVGVLIKDTSNDQTIVDVECTGGFVGATPDLDGDIDKFKACREELSRGLYWIVRSRLQTLAATTLVHVAPLPWDFSSSEELDEASDEKSTDAAKKRPGKSAKKPRKRA